MGSDSYRVDILHFINPHLLWVEVYNTRSEDFIFEQIGVYGVLPQEVTIDDVTLNVETRRCEQWTPAAFLVMKKLFSDADEIWFSPIHIDRRTSLFDDNIHKYGELVIKKKNGKLKSLSQQLLKSGFALYDTGLFHTDLSAGNIKTKLNTYQKQDIIKQLENPDKKPLKDWQKAVKKQTTVFQKEQNLESMLTVRNLEKHEKVQQLLQNKLKDFDRCKDVDEESVGRAVSRLKDKGQSIKNAASVTPGKKKLDLLRHKSKTASKNDTAVAFNLTKKYLVTNAVKRVSDVLDSQKSDDATVKTLMATKKFLEENVVDSTTDEIDSSSTKTRHSGTQRDSDIDGSNGHEFHSDEKCHKLEDNTVTYEAVPTAVRPRKVKKKSPKIPECDPCIEKRIAYGPPGFDHGKLSYKVIPKDTIEDDVNIKPKDDDMAEERPQNPNMFDGLDSEVNIAITNKEELIEIRKNTLDNEKKNPAVEVIVSQSNFKNQGNNYRRKNVADDVKSQTDSSSENTCLRSKFLLRKLNLHKARAKVSDDSLSSSDVAKDSSTSMEEQKDESEEEQEDVLQKLNIEYPKTPKKEENAVCQDVTPVEFNVNPFKNVDPTMSVFVDKLVTPVLMVHSKMNKRIQPCMELRDFNFNTNVHIALTNLSVKHPMMIQSVSWFTILRGYSLFMVSPQNSGKTMGYLPAVCRLVSDYKADTLSNEGPSCIIVCATAKAASEVEKLSKMFLGLQERVLACYTGMDELHITTALLNGCDLLICTPSVLVRLMQMTDFGVDLRRLATFVLDDCERLSQVYINEVKYFLIKIKEMLKARANKELKVQIIAASRIWCDFMGPLAKKAPNSVVCIGAFQECVLYSKTNTTVAFVKKENKVNAVLDFLKQIDASKRTVIVCRDDDEVDILEKSILKLGKVVFACNNTMTVQDLYNHSKNWSDYQEPLLGPILVCCDGNLIHMNVTNAHYLLHFSLPQLFSMFCKRFAVLNDNYASIFDENIKDVRIKILLDDANVEQLPKILNFIKRCTDGTPQFLDDVCDKVLAEKDAVKADKLVPICNSLLAIGECPDFWNCQERHAVFSDHDEPKDWMPKTGIVTFKILHYHNAVLYSVRLLTNIVNGKTVKYPQTYSTLSLKMGMYYSKESNKKLHGVPKVGDVCAVSVKLNFFARCQVMKILSNYKNGKPNFVLIKLIDEEKYECCSDVYLYYLPDELKNIETHIVRVRLANIKPKDKDVTFSDLATHQLKKITEKQDLYLRGKVSMSIGNCVLVDTLEACQDLTSLNETVVNEDFRKILLDVHAIPNPEHVPNLVNLCQKGKLVLDDGNQVVEASTATKPAKDQLKPDWAHLEDGVQSVFFTTAENPDTFFVRLVKFEECMDILLKDIEKYVTDNPEPLTEVKRGDFVLAKFPDDQVYERARIDEVYDENKVKCFFVDQGDWRDILYKDLIEIPDKFLTQMPCQAIECRLTGVSPAGEDWTEFGNNWFTDACFEDDNGKIKQLYLKYFTKDVAVHTEGHKYGVALIDTNGDDDVLINQLMIEKNLAHEKLDEVKYFSELTLSKHGNTVASHIYDDEWVKVSGNEIKALQNVEEEVQTPKESLDKVFPKKPIRSVPLVQEEDEDDRWDVNIASDFMAMFKNLVSGAQKGTKPQDVPKPNTEKTNLPAIKYNPVNSSANEIVTEEKKASNVKESPKIVNVNLPDVKSAPKEVNTELDSDDFSSSESTVSSKIQTDDHNKMDNENKMDELRKPKIIWREHSENVIIKIMLIGVESYDLEIGDRTVKFETYANDTKYGFDFELYGVIDRKSYVHSNRGQYILINLTKVLNKRWLTLTRDVGIKKWIVYDVDSIDTSSDEETVDSETIKNIVQNQGESESGSDDDFIDDSRF